MHCNFFLLKSIFYSTQISVLVPGTINVANQNYVDLLHSMRIYVQKNAF